MYNAMLLKTSTSSYLKYRTWTLTAAKNLFPGSCTEFNTVKAAWNAVSVPAQSGDPTCTGGGTTPPTTTPTPADRRTRRPAAAPARSWRNPGFESRRARRGPAPPASHRPVGQPGPGRPQRHATALARRVRLHPHRGDPAVGDASRPGASATLTFYLHIDTAETTTTSGVRQADRHGRLDDPRHLSNLNKASGYQLRSVQLSALAGQTVTIKFSGTEDSSLQTSFVLDDSP